MREPGSASLLSRPWARVVALVSAPLLLALWAYRLGFWSA